MVCSGEGKRGREYCFVLSHRIGFCLPPSPFLDFGRFIAPGYAGFELKAVVVKGWAEAEKQAQADLQVSAWLRWAVILDCYSAMEALFLFFPNSNAKDRYLDRNAGQSWRGVARPARTGNY